MHCVFGIIACIIFIFLNLYTLFQFKKDKTKSKQIIAIICSIVCLLIAIVCLVMQFLIFRGWKTNCIHENTSQNKTYRQCLVVYRFYFVCRGIYNFNVWFNKCVFILLWCLRQCRSQNRISLLLQKSFIQSYGIPVVHRIVCIFFQYIHYKLWKFQRVLAFYAIWQFLSKTMQNRQNSNLHLFFTKFCANWQLTLFAIICIMLLTR